MTAEPGRVRPATDRALVHPALPQLLDEPGTRDARALASLAAAGPDRPVSS